MGSPFDARDGRAWARSQRDLDVGRRSTRARRAAQAAPHAGSPSARGGASTQRPRCCAAPAGLLRTSHLHDHEPARAARPCRLTTRAHSRVNADWPIRIGAEGTPKRLRAPGPARTRPQPQVAQPQEFCRIRLPRRCPRACHGMQHASQASPPPRRAPGIAILRIRGRAVLRSQDTAARGRCPGVVGGGGSRGGQRTFSEEQICTVRLSLRARSARRSY